MLAAVMAHVDKCHAVIKAAAVADYRPIERKSNKIKKKDEVATIELIKNPDILALLGKLEHHPFLVGFAAETGTLCEYAAKKLSEKNLDMIVANDVSQPDAGFNVDTNRALLLFKDGRSVECSLMSKDKLAGEILDHIVKGLESC
jgi:phosphopantothenoylcysteine decarboxylase/phosphopantothenate--cysteine ligase